MRLSLNFEDFGWAEAYHAARQFRSMSRDEQEQLVKDFLAQLDPTESALDDLDWEASERGSVSLGDSALTVGNTLRNVIKDGKNLVKRKISWKQFGTGVEQCHDELAVESGDLAAHHRRVRPLLELAAGIVTSLLKRIDSGNREEAEKYAKLIADEKRSLVQNLS